MSDWTFLEYDADLDIEIERYELAGVGGRVSDVEPRTACTDARHPTSDTLTRRDLLKVFGAGLVVLCLVDSSDAQESGGGRRQRFGGGQAPREIGAWIHVGEDGGITAFSGKAEVGQNARTSLTMVVAEELRVPITAVRMVMADTDLTPYDMGTFGSMTTPRMVPVLREAAAAARETLIDLAAAGLKCDRGSLDVEGGRIARRGSGDALTYGQVAKGRKLAQVIQPVVPTTPPAQWQIEGHPAHKVNAREMVTGRHKYTSDMKRPGMLYARVLRPEAVGATLVSADATAAEKLPGVKVIRTAQITGVVGPTQHAAGEAIASIKAEWKTEPSVSSSNLFEHLKKTAPNGGPMPDELTAALAHADVKLRAEYAVAYIAHAPLEPRAAVAEWNGDRLTVWTGTQRPFGVKEELASAFGMPLDRVRVFTPDTGSGYGGKHTGECAIEAARLAKEAGKPVKLVWTREEEFRFAYFRPAGVIEVESGVSKDGTLVAWDYHNYNSGGSAIQTPYDVAAKRTQFHNSRSPLRQGSYRGLAATANNFAREVHLDELAHAVMMDPLAFRLKNLKEPRLRAVLEAAAEKFGWGKAQPAPGHAFGLACGTEKGSVVATCAEIAMEPQANSGTLKPPKFHVVRAVTAFECGAIINPEHLQNQVEGAVIMGLGGALFEAIEFENGALTNPRFSKYRVPRFGDVPKLQTILLDRKDIPSAGAGETPIIAIAPAISNAVFAATGERLRSLPMMPGRA